MSNAKSRKSSAKKSTPKKVAPVINEEQEVVTEMAAEKSVVKAEKQKNDDKKKAKKSEPRKEVKQGFFKGVKLELSKVKWPDAKEIVKYTVATLAFCVVLGLFFEGLNVLSTLIKGLFS